MRKQTLTDPRHTELRRMTAADRQAWIRDVGTVGWQAELNRRRAVRNERTRQRTREALAARGDERQQMPLWGAP